MRSTTGNATGIELCNQYLDWMEHTKRRSSATVYAYGQTYKRLLAELDVPLLEATPEHLRVWLYRPRRGGAKPAPASIKRELCAVRAMFKWATARELVDHDPTLVLMDETPRIDNEAPKPVPLADWRRVWFSDLTDTERVFLGFGAFVGLRRAEMTSLCPDQVHLDPPLLAGVRRKGGKRQGFHYGSCVTLYEQRLPEWVGDAAQMFWGPLQRLTASRTGRVSLFPWADERNPRYVTRTVHHVPVGVVNPDLLNKKLRAVFVRLDLDPLLFSPHQLRHSFCTNLISVGVRIEVVSQLAGHSSLDVTRRYVELGEDPLAKLVDPVMGFRNRFGE